jgi:hypothetical protein
MATNSHRDKPPHIQSKPKFAPVLHPPDTHCLHQVAHELEERAKPKPKTLNPPDTLYRHQVAQELEERAKSWKATLQEDVGKVLREAADQSVFEMEQAFKAYTDAVKADEEKWKMVAERCLNPKP